MFDHRDPGTPEFDWVRTTNWASVVLLDPAGVRSAAVIAAHPDDETLGAGGLLAQLHRHGAYVTLVLATHGEASHSRDVTAQRLAEFKTAAQLVAPGCRFVDLGLPDGGLLEHRETLERRDSRRCSPVPTSSSRRGVATATETTGSRARPPTRSREGTV